MMTQKTITVVTSMILFSISTSALADRELERAEILQVFEALTSRPKTAWIPAGTINATREQYRAAKTTDADEIAAAVSQQQQQYIANPDKIELTDELQKMRLEAIPFNVRYRLSNEYTMNSNVIVKYDGTRFYWEINVDSRADSVQPDPALAGNFLTEAFSLHSNGKRVFAWDGAKYTTYFRPINHAIVTDSPSGVNGPLTAGVIPWGYGRYSLKNLSAAEATATETQLDGLTEIQLIVINNDRQETFILDPAKDYALKRYSAIDAAGTMRLHNYGNYQSIGDNWCPTSILIEKYDTTTTTTPPTAPHKLTARDIWAFTAVSGATPADAGFDVTYEYDAYVEDFSLGGEPLRYRYSEPQPPTAKQVDTDDIITSRLMIVSHDQSTNCATAAIAHIAAHFGKNATLKDLSQMLGRTPSFRPKGRRAARSGEIYSNRFLDSPFGPTRNDKAFGSQPSKTSLLALQRAAENIGLYTKAVKTDIAALKDLTNYKVILHLPKINHFVVLGDIDDKYIRLIDLTSNRFYYRQSIDSFNSAWEGTAFLVAAEPVTAARRFAQIDAPSLKKIIAGACEQCNDSCSDAGQMNCIVVAGSCGSSHIIWYSRVCCGSASSGSCSATSLIYKKEETCGENPYTGDCEGEGNWTSYYMDACA